MSELRAKIVELTNSGMLQSDIAEQLGIGLGAIRHQLQVERGTYKSRVGQSKYTNTVPRKTQAKYTPCVQICLSCRKNFRAWDRKLNRICDPCKVED